MGSNQHSYKLPDLDVTKSHTCSVYGYEVHVRLSSIFNQYIINMIDRNSNGFISGYTTIEGLTPELMGNLKERLRKDLIKRTSPLWKALEGS